MSGLIVFVTVPDRPDTVVELDVSATVGDLLQQFSEQTGLVARGIFWEDTNVKDEKLALADLGICPQSRVRVQLGGLCGWVQQGIVGSEGNDAVIMHVESGVFAELSNNSNGWFRWSEKDVERKGEENLQARMAWSNSSPSSDDFQEMDAHEEYAGLLDKRVKHELPGEHMIEDIFGEERSFEWGHWTLYRCDWGILVRNKDDTQQRIMLLPDRLVVFTAFRKAWYPDIDSRECMITAGRAGCAEITGDETEELNEMLGDHKLTPKDCDDWVSDGSEDDEDEDDDGD
eukprot:Hpha_TRINITY_DN18514_c0_g1::TRINITY_DN18514_c0_g1_i1::g.195309::m.195309